METKIQSVLFERVRAWLTNCENTASLRKPLAEAVSPMLDALEAGRLLLDFTFISPDDRDSSRTNFYKNDQHVPVIDLRSSAQSVGARQMDNLELGFLAIEALSMYVEYVLYRKPRVRAPSLDLV